MVAPGDRARWADWLQQARDRLAEDGRGPLTEPLEIVLRSGPHRVVSITQPPDPPPEGNGHALPALSPDERAVVKAILAGGNRPTVAKKLATKAGLSWNGDFRFLLSNLCKREPPVLESGPTGYVVAAEVAAGIRIPPPERAADRQG